MFWSRLPGNGHAVWGQLHDLQHEMNRLFDRWGDRGRQFLGLFPAINLWEADDALFVEAELPGMELKDLEIFVTGRNQLTLKGTRQAPVVEKGVQHRQERGFGTFTRTVTLPVPVDEANVEARLEHGVLKIRLPKHEGARPRKIEIKS